MSFAPGRVRKVGEENIVAGEAVDIAVRGREARRLYESLQAGVATVGRGRRFTIWQHVGGNAGVLKMRFFSEFTMSVETAFKYVLDGDLRILVTDDDPIMREFATVYLGAPSVAIETADCGEAGLARLESEHFDLAMIDIDMPGIDGYEMLTRIRASARLKDLPVVIVTSNEDIASIDRAYALGATSFVTKPVNWRLLAYQLRFVLRAGRRMAA